MATPKSKKTKESTVVPVEKVKKVIAKEIASVASEIKTVAKAVTGEAKKTKKVAAPAEVVAVTKDQEMPKDDKKIKKAKATPVISEVAAATEAPKAAIAEKAVKKTATKSPAKKAAVVTKPEVVTPQTIETPVEAVAPVVETEVKLPVTEAKSTLKVTFQLKFSSRFGQSLFVTGNNEIFGNGDIEKALPLQYFNNEFWYTTIELETSKLVDADVVYNYALLEDGQVTVETAGNKVINFAKLGSGDVLLVDTWNDVMVQEREMYAETAAATATEIAASTEPFTHTFKVKAPQLPEGLAVFISGNVAELGNWSEEKVQLLSYNAAEGFWTINLDLTNATLPIAYKYGVYNKKENELVQFETGENRIFFGAPEAKDLTIITDGVVYLPNNAFAVAV